MNRISKLFMVFIIKATAFAYAAEFPVPVADIDWVPAYDLLNMPLDPGELNEVKNLFALYPVYNFTETWEMIFKPIELLTPWRFDITAKYLYAKFREMNIKSDWGKEVYLEHLHVWGNFHETYPVKNGPDDFIKSFNIVLDNIKKEGFNNSFGIVPVDNRKLLLNGAHRVTACLLYNQSVRCKYYSNHQAPCATAQFFQNAHHYVPAGLESKYLDSMATTYAQLKKNTYVAVVYPAAKGKLEEVEQIFSGCAHIVYAKWVDLHHEGPFNLVKQAYERDHWAGNWDTNFAGLRNYAAKCFPGGKGMLRVYLLECDSFDALRECKNQIRALYGIGNHVMHATDNHEQTLDLAYSLFNENSIHFMNYAKLQNFEKFTKYLPQYKQWMKDAGVNQECFAVDSSAVLSAYGIRDCADLDFLHHGYYKESAATGNPFVSSHNSSLNHHVLTLDEMIFNPQNHFYYKGVKFVSLEAIKAMKTKRDEWKDRRDLVLIEEHFKIFD